MSGSKSRRGLPARLLGRPCAPAKNPRHQIRPKLQNILFQYFIFEFSNGSVMLIRFLILGAQGVGKSFIISYLNHSPDQHLGIDYEIKYRKLTIGEFTVQVCGDSYSLPTFDEADPNQHPESNDIISLVQEADCIFFVYRVSDPASFNCVKSWMLRLQDQLSGTSVFLVRNNSGLPTEQVSTFD
jgi:GTPase SAR1 family protein